MGTLDFLDMVLPADWRLQCMLVGRVALAALWGGMIGFQRERVGHAAGVRTCAVVAMGSCAFSAVGTILRNGPNGDVDPTRIAAQVVSGIGFLGAGVIIHERGRVNGLTTAAALWSCAAVGMADGFGLHILAGGTALLIVFLLSLGRSRRWQKFVGGSEFGSGEQDFVGPRAGRGTALILPDGASASKDQRSAAIGSNGVHDSPAGKPVSG